MDFRALFGLHSVPFTRELPVEHRFDHAQFTEVLDNLLRVLGMRMSAALVAPAGCGKTALVRALCARLPDARYRVHYIKVSSLSKRDMCREITAVLRLPSRGSMPGLIREIQRVVRGSQQTDGIRTVFILDDAHELRPEVLAILKTLTNFDMDSKLLLSLLLVGKPPLADLLRRPDLEDVARRLAHYATLRLMSRDETKAYVDHRCIIAGAKTVPYDIGAHEAIYEIGHGNLRATDRLALGALQAAAGKKSEVVNHTHVIDARRSLWP